MSSSSIIIITTTTMPVTFLNSIPAKWALQISYKLISSVKNL
jgi:hypothetical protein